TGEVRPDAAHVDGADAVQLGRALEDARPVVDERATPRHARVELEVHVGDVQRGTRRLGDGVERLDARDGDVDAGQEELLEGLPRRVEPDEDGRGDAVGPQR